jgi:signal transduction histidine kinase
MFKKSISDTGKGKKTYKDYLRSLLHLLGSLKFRLFIVLVLVTTIPIYVTNIVINYYYRQAMIQNELAVMQTKAVVIASEVSGHASLYEAEKDGTYSQLVKYSTLNSVRIRVLSVNFVVSMDSYSIENGKAVINSRAISAYNSGKNYSGYDKNTGTIEVAVPIYNANGEILGTMIFDMDVSEIDSFSESVKNQINIIRTAMITVILAISLIIVRTIFRRFQKTFRIVEDVANGHTEKRLPNKGYSELKDFANDFNTIMDKANTLDQTRQEFVSNVSHELRTPITSIKVLADSLNTQENVPIELYQEFMQDIAKEIDRESKIIEDLLSIVRMDKSAALMDITSVNLNELLEIVLKRLKPIAQKKNVEILFESFRPVVAEIDEVKFTQVISNLVENAIKYNKIDGWVHVSLNADYQYFYVRVEDSGIGIPKENQDMVFERFYRVDKARSRETGGTGLGLAIVKNIILLHHGTVKLHSEEGVGTTFTVRIPLNYVE